VSYKKGCYTGQEVLMRIHSRGHTNRTWMALTSDTEMPVGARVRHRNRDDAGVVTSAGDSPDYGPIAGAMLRAEAAIPNENVEVETSEGWVPARVHLMPILRME
jgi:folate-binding Fe-S cluster repair protein YgfZ